MSKSTGNFLTLRQTVEKFGADAARIAIADAGDAIEDANFEETVANKTVLKLFELKKWLQEMKEDVVLVDSTNNDAQKCDSSHVKNMDLVQRTGAFNLWDKLFENELTVLVRETDAHYSKYAYSSHDPHDKTAGSRD